MRTPFESKNLSGSAAAGVCASTDVLKNRRAAATPEQNRASIRLLRVPHFTSLVGARGAGRGTWGLRLESRPRVRCPIGFDWRNTLVATDARSEFVRDRLGF